MLGFDHTFFGGGAYGLVGFFQGNTTNSSSVRILKKKGTFQFKNSQWMETLAVDPD